MEKIKQLLEDWQKEYDQLNKAVSDILETENSDSKYLKLAEYIGARNRLGIAIVQLKSSTGWQTTD